KLVVAGAAYSNVTAGDFALARYNPDGSLDSTFGASGKVMTEFGFGWDVANALALQPDGKIVVAGSAYSGPDHDFAIARYNSDGSLDTSFNGTGKVITSIGPGNDYANSVALQPDGKIVVAGRSLRGSSGDLPVVAYNADCPLDATPYATSKATPS